MPPLGVHVLTISDAGFSNIINNGHPIEKPEDAKGMNIRVMESPGLIAYMNALGCQPVPDGHERGLYGPAERHA